MLSLHLELSHSFYLVTLIALVVLFLKAMKLKTIRSILRHREEISLVDICRLIFYDILSNIKILYDTYKHLFYRTCMCF